MSILKTALLQAAVAVGAFLVVTCASRTAGAGVAAAATITLLSAGLYRTIPERGTALLCFLAIGVGFAASASVLLGAVSLGVLMYVSGVVVYLTPAHVRRDESPFSLMLCSWLLTLLVAVPIGSICWMFRAGPHAASLGATGLLT